ncbi:hypothetical protein D3C73_1291990 [compost metagenome]
MPAHFFTSGLPRFIDCISNHFMSMICMTNRGHELKHLFKQFMLDTVNIAFQKESVNNSSCDKQGEKKEQVGI